MTTNTQNVLAFNALPTPAAPQAPVTDRDANGSGRPGNVVPFRAKRREARCDPGQGYLVGRPMAQDALTDFLTGRQTS